MKEREQFTKKLLNDNPKNEIAAFLKIKKNKISK